MRELLLTLRKLRLIAAAATFGVALFGGVVPAASLASTSASALIHYLRVIPERNAGYDRDNFADWIDADSDGCDTRQEVLLRQNRRSAASCDDDQGLWFSAYDGTQIRAAADLDVDHFVPLAEAWGSGAWNWNPATRDAYSNDLYRRSLIAVTASSNRSKGDSDPSEWLPPRASFRCRYMTLWVATKYRWRLAIDQNEKSILGRSLRRCPDPSTNTGSIARAVIRRTKSIRSATSP